MDENNEIYQRLEDLEDVLAYCATLQNLGKAHVFRVGERICINQERGSLFSQLNTENKAHERRYYKISESIEAKVKFTLETIKATSWRKNY